MKNIKNKIIVLLGLALLLYSCQDDFLDQKNPNQLPASEFWKTTADLEGGLNAAYQSFKDEDCVSMVDENERSDMAYPNYLRPLSGKFEYYQQLFNNTSNLPNKKWAALYQGVFRTNQVIEAYKRLEGTFGTTGSDNEMVALRIYAEARAMRGWYYFMLHNTFNKGSVILFDFVPKDKTQYQKPLAPATEVLKFYRDDLEFAKEKLLLVAAATSNITVTNTGHFSAGTCEALLGKSYLYQGDFDKAAGYFKNVIDNYNYALMPSIGSNFTTKDEFNIESILEVNYTTALKADQTSADQLLSSSLGRQIGPGGYNGSFPASWLIMKYKKDPVDLLDPKNTGITDVYGVTRNRRFSERTSYSIALPDDTNSDFGFYGANTTAELAKFGRQQFCYWRKGTNWDIQTKDETNTSTGIAGRSAVNIRLIRLADVFLMYAECKIESGDLATAIKYINKVRKRSHVVLLGSATASENAEFNDGKTSFNDVTYSKTTLTEHLRHTERPLELSFENGDMRLLDLRRWGITKERFQKLASLRYDQYNLVANGNGKHPVRYKCVIYDTGDTPDSNTSNQNIKASDLNEFELAAVNYDFDQVGYLPIPLSEINSNANLYK